jgi:hypothetical protein
VIAVAASIQSDNETVSTVMMIDCHGRSLGFRGFIMALKALSAPSDASNRHEPVVFLSSLRGSSRWKKVGSPIATASMDSAGGFLREARFFLNRCSNFNFLGSSSAVRRSFAFSDQLNGICQNAADLVRLNPHCDCWAMTDQ